MSAQNQNAPAQQNQDPRVQVITKVYPDYQNWTAQDFSKMDEGILRTWMGAFALKLNPEALIPESFVRKYGENAAGEMAVALEREAGRRGISEVYATAILDGGIGNAGKSNRLVNSNVPASVSLVGDKVAYSTAPKILNYSIAQDAVTHMGQNETDRQQGHYKPQGDYTVVIPQSVTKAVVAANASVPASLGNQVFSFKGADELAFMSGYATRAGASRDIGPIKMDYEAATACSVEDLRNQIFNSKKPDVDYGLAWAAGYIQRDIDTNPALQQALHSCPVKTARTASR